MRWCFDVQMSVISFFVVVVMLSLCKASRRPKDEFKSTSHHHMRELEGSWPHIWGEEMFFRLLLNFILFLLVNFLQRASSDAWTLNDASVCLADTEDLQWKPRKILSLWWNAARYLEIQNVILPFPSASLGLGLSGSGRPGWQRTQPLCMPWAPGAAAPCCSFKLCRVDPWRI